MNRVLTCISNLGTSATSR